MSNSKKIKSKRRHRVARNRKQRSQGKPVVVDIESGPFTDALSYAEIGTRTHQDIERVLTGHYHIGDAHGAMDYMQLMAYASMMPPDCTLAIYGGDLIHEMPVHEGAYDVAVLHKLQEDMNDAIARAMSPSMGWNTVRDPRRNPVTGQIRPVINDDE